jgi:FkbM family methyltransferase
VNIFYFIKNLLKKKFKRFYALNFLDKKMLEFINYKNGFYIECGANDGLKQSNTFYYENFKNWNGVLIEPSQKYYELIKNRSKKNFFFKNACVSFKDENKKVKLMYNNLMTVALTKKNQIIDKNKFIDEGKKFLKKKENNFEFKIKGISLNRILDSCKSPSVIDFFSLDVEGMELEVLKGIKFNKYKFKFILIECQNFKKINTFLRKKNYIFVKKLSYHDYLFKSL